METPPEPGWTPERLQKLIDDKIEEGPQLDYKAAAALGRSDSKKAEITKDISAFANAAGGTVIYGLREFDDDVRKHLPEKIDPVDGGEFSKEWLDQIIGQISPRIDNLKITPVRVGPAAHQACYVVEIPKGLTAHQARDLKYYKRSNFESVPMADYEIRDVMNRRKHPQMDFMMRVTPTEYMTTKIYARVWNRGTVLAKQFRVRVLIPTVLGNSKIDGKDLVLQENGAFKFWRISLGNPLSPIFPGDDAIVERELTHVRSFQFVPEPTTDYMICTLFADEMPSIQRQVLVAPALHGWV